MLHDASGPTWRQTCFVPLPGPDPRGEGLSLAVLGRFASSGGFVHHQLPSCPALHLVHGGAGTLHAGGRTLHAGPGSVFCFAPGEAVRYADLPGRPWRYTWLNLVGTRAHELLGELGGSGGSCGAWVRDDLPLAIAARLCDEIEAAFRSEEYSHHYPVAAAWRILDALSPRPSGKQRALHLAVAVRRIIDAQFNAPLRIGGLARHFGVDRSTLFRQFHALYGQTPKAYLDGVRLDHAAALLRGGAAVGEAAARCGYGNAQRFAKAFAQRFGQAPSRWRRGVISAG